MKNDIMLSVIIISYNQEKYIRDAIDSVINQKTEYKYEIILADDCSKDNTFNIMEEYATRYHDKVVLLKRKFNLGATNNSFTACCESKGKYIAILEGDDYWCDKNKIQLQISFLEKNKDYIAVSHIQKGIDEENNITGYFPSWVSKDCDVTIDDFLKEKLFSETSTIFRNIYLNDKLKYDIKQLAGFSKEVGDYQKCILLLSEGKVRIINKPMMIYRNFHNSNNYNSRYKLDEICLEHIKITNKLDNYYDRKYNFYSKYARYYSLGLSYDILHLNFKNFKLIMNFIPKEYKNKIIFSYPIVMLKIFFYKLKGVRK